MTFATNDGKSATLHPHEFIRRFLLHVLPKGFSKIRHYGLHASGNVKTKLPVAQRLLSPPVADSDSGDSEQREARPDWQHLLQELTGIDVSRCPNCGSASLRRVPLPDRRHAGATTPPARAPPGASP